jgi:hypothetical protein
MQAWAALLETEWLAGISLPASITTTTLSTCAIPA